MKNKKMVIKHSAAIAISNQVSLLQRKAWNVLLANAYDDLDKRDEFQVSLKELCETLKFDSNNLEYLKDTLKELGSIQVLWNVLGKDKKEKGWGFDNLLAGVRLVDGYCFYAYSPFLRKKLHHPEMYAKISLSLQNNFNSRHSLALYELCVDHFIVVKGYGQTNWVNTEDFRKLCGLIDDEYKEFMDLNKYVIKKSIEEINLKTDLLVSVEFQRKIRKIVALKFHIKKNPDSIIDVEPILKSLSSDTETAAPSPEQESINQELYQTLASYGISKAKIFEILKAHDESYIQDVLAHVDAKVKTGKVKDVPAFTVKSIEKDFRSRKTKFDIQKEKQEQQRIEKAREQQEAANKRAQEEVSKLEQERAIEQAISTLQDSDRKALRIEAERNVIGRLGLLPANANRFEKKNRQVVIEIEMQKIFIERKNKKGKTYKT